MRLLFSTFILLCVFSINATADHHFEIKKDTKSAEDIQLAIEITDFLDLYAKAYNNQDYQTVKSLWDGDDPSPIYMAEEVPFPLYGWKRMHKYFNPRPGKKILDGIYNEYSDVRAKYLSPTIAVATYKLTYDIKLVGIEPMHGWDRVMAVFINKGETNAPDWKLTAYAEAPMGPATMVRKMMRAVPAENDQQKADYKTTKQTIKSMTQRGVAESFQSFIDERKDLMPTH